MFSREEKIRIAAAVENVLLEIHHPEMPEVLPHFNLHVLGKETWNFADIGPNWLHENVEADPEDWNEVARKWLASAPEKSR